MKLKRFRLTKEQAEEVRVYLYRNRISQGVLAHDINRSRMAVNRVLNNDTKFEMGNVPSQIWRWYLKREYPELEVEV